MQSPSGATNISVHRSCHRLALSIKHLCGLETLLQEETDKTQRAPHPCTAPSERAQPSSRYVRIPMLHVRHGGIWVEKLVSWQMCLSDCGCHCCLCRARRHIQHALQCSVCPRMTFVYCKHPSANHITPKLRFDPACELELRIVIPAVNASLCCLFELFTKTAQICLSGLGAIIFLFSPTRNRSVDTRCHRRIM